MSMSVDRNTTASAPLARPNHGSHRLDANALAWLPTESPGFWVKPLLADAASGARTELMRIDPGAHVGERSHDQLEEIYVLSGEFSDAERTYGPGDYCVRAVGAVHVASSKTGCTMLLVYRA
jgi:anti-sigma factor ChrR (cupin superfamily)